MLGAALALPRETVTRSVSEGKAECVLSLAHASGHHNQATPKSGRGYTPGRIEAHEFDYKGINQVVYEENGVVIRSTPAVHTGDGSVSYSLEFAGLKFVFGGDT